jgi:lipoprotein-releasing system ATP-binding protein
MAEQPILRAMELVKTFGEGDLTTEVIRGISLTFAPGEFTAIVGPSGSGKSTLLYMLGALEKPTAGSIAIAGEELATLNDVQLAALRNRTLGFIFQFHFLLAEFTARENIALPLLIDGNLALADALVRADALLERVGLANRRDARPSQLSGGQAQRVAIARALINNPRIVFCDEPTGSLDSHSAEQVYQLLRELNAEFGQTIIVVTHEPSFADRSDRTIRLVDGVIESDIRRTA